MTATIKKPKEQDILFYLAYGLYLVFGILSTSFYYKYFMGMPFRVIHYLCFGLLIVREFMVQKYTIQSLVIGGIFVTFIFITKAQTSFSTIGYILIFIFCARNVDFRKIAKFSIWISAIVVFLVVMSAYVGIIENYNFSSSIRQRYGIGFRYPLYSACFLFNITGLVLYVGGERLKWRWSVVLVAVNYWIFTQTDSRLSFYLSLLMIAVFGLLKLRPNFFNHKRILCWAMILSFAFCFCISVYFTIVYDSSVVWQGQLNKILGGRLRLGHSSLLQSGVSLFGQRLELSGAGLDAFGLRNPAPYNYVDSFYIQVLQRYGIIFSMFWIGLLTLTMYRYYKIKDFPMMFCLTFIAFHCVLDDLSLSLHYNTFWLVATLIIRNYAKKPLCKQENSVSVSQVKKVV